MKKSLADHPDDLSHMPLQLSLERLVKEISILGGFDFTFLLNHEGLSLAQYTSNSQMDELAVVEMCAMLDRINNTLKSNLGISDLHEVTIEAKEGRRLIFRFIQFYNQIAVLALMVPPRKSYRGLLNRLQKNISKCEIGEEPII
jgi:hypothetical protein